MIPSNYSDLVAFIGEDNSPPGAMHTVASWISNAKIDRNSIVLDLACNTAYSSRSVVQLQPCSAFGLDLSPYVIRQARAKVRRTASAIHFVVANAEAIPLASRSMTHILAGSVFGFFSCPERSLHECARVLKPSGYLCVANFYYVQRPPSALLDSVAKAAGVQPRPSWTKEYWNGFFGSKFHLVSDFDAGLSVETREAILTACHVSTARSREFQVATEDDYRKALQQLFYYRLIFNEHRRYQRYAVQVWQR